MKLRRIWGLVLRNIYLHRRSLPRLMEIAFWPVMDMMVWGFVTVWMQRSGANLPRLLEYVLGALVLWTLLYRAQLGVTVAFLEDIWTRNFVNIFVTPVRLDEIFVATGVLSAAKALATAAILVPVAWGLYGCDVTVAGVTGLGAMVILLGMGWAVGLFTTALIFRYGHASEALAWGIPFLIQPLSAVFYPVDVLPPWIRPVSWCLPSTHAFEALRSLLVRGQAAPLELITGALLLVPWSLAAIWYFRTKFREVRELGILAKAGLE